ncbi:otogelin-like [Sinocyclocheilus grahami]|uniref:otogelin-like n=1 Tax=Sinocyclocheilus grahami TaxID=75366 RepID=UPI0007ACC7B3|nr:PREDICTED: otogelin-like [Sinocyclocheilus grahami]
MGIELTSSHTGEGLNPADLSFVNTTNIQNILCDCQVTPLYITVAIGGRLTGESRSISSDSHESRMDPILTPGKKLVLLYLLFFILIYQAHITWCTESLNLTHQHDYENSSESSRIMLEKWDPASQTEQRSLESNTSSTEQTEAQKPSSRRATDGLYYYFPGKCSYTLLRDCEDSTRSSVHIQVHNDPECSSFPYSCARSISLFLPWEGEIRLQNFSVTFKGQSVQLPHHIHDVELERISDYIVVSQPQGFTLAWQGLTGSVYIKMSPEFVGHTCGLCGNFNADTQDDLKTSYGVFTQDLAMFGNSWAEEEPQLGGCPVVPSLYPSPCATQDPRVLLKVEEVCATLLKEPFQSCHEFVSPNSYMASCSNDLCLSGPNGDVVCQVFTEYARACAHAGHALHNWRAHFPVCSVDCPGELLFRECITCCPMHCKIEHMCIDSKLQCLDGCYCPDDLIYENGVCVKASECPCEHHGMLYPSGLVIQEDCNNCTCVGGIWNCTEHSCPGECSVTGDMFFQSFDGRIYTFPATCQYVLAKSRNSGKFTVTIQNAPCGANLDGACIQSVNLMVDEDPHTEITMSHSGEVFLASQFRISLPYSDDVLQIQELSSMFVQVKSSQGLRLQYNWREFRLYLQLEKQWRDDTVGLCGTFNGNIQDDFLAPSGMIESTPYLFGNAWRVSSACVPRPILPQLDPCDTHQQAAAYAVEKCDVLMQEVFSACREYVSPVGFQLQCRADVCKCGAPCLCSILAHYARTCRRHGVIIEFRSHLPECAITCPSTMEYGVCVSSCQRRCLFLSLPQLCGDECEEGCVCPEGTYFNMHTHTCVPRSECPCSFLGADYFPGDVVMTSSGVQICQDGKLVSQSSIIDTMCPPGQFYEDCGNRADSHSANKGLACEQTCESYLLNLTCSTHEPCMPGCVCPTGLLEHGDECFEPHACPCLWKGKEYYPGDRVSSPCHQCVCQHGTFQCEFRPCPSMCTAYGDRHYRTFDGFLFDYIGACKVYLVKSSLDSMMTVTAENVDCFESGVICRKSLLISLGRSFIVFDDDTGKPNPSSVIERQRVYIWQAGYYTIVHLLGEDLTVLWDRKTTVHIQAGPRWQGKLTGLCGNFDQKTANEMRTPENIDSSTPQEFGNSWTAAECVNSPDIRHPCNLNPLREPFAKRQCGILLSEVFQVCHPVVDVTWFYMNCLVDTCGCNRGGDCECFCTSVAAYAHRCCQKGVTIDWRSPSVCPYDCEYYNKVSISETLSGTSTTSKPTESLTLFTRTTTIPSPSTFSPTLSSTSSKEPIRVSTLPVLPVSTSISSTEATSPTVKVSSPLTYSTENPRVSEAFIPTEKTTMPSVTSSGSTQFPVETISMTKSTSSSTTTPMLELSTSVTTEKWTFPSSLHTVKTPGSTSETQKPLDITTISTSPTDIEASTTHITVKSTSSAFPTPPSVQTPLIPSTTTSEQPKTSKTTVSVSTAATTTFITTVSSQAAFVPTETTAKTTYQPTSIIYPYPDVPTTDGTLQTDWRVIQTTSTLSPETTQTSARTAKTPLTTYTTMPFTSAPTEETSTLLTSHVSPVDKTTSRVVSASTMLSSTESHWSLVSTTALLSDKVSTSPVHPPYSMTTMTTTSELPEISPASPSILTMATSVSEAPTKTTETTITSEKPLLTSTAAEEIVSTTQTSTARPWSIHTITETTRVSLDTDRAVLSTTATTQTSTLVHETSSTFPSMTSMTMIPKFTTRVTPVLTSRVAVATTRRETPWVVATTSISLPTRNATTLTTPATTYTDKVTTVSTDITTSSIPVAASSTLPTHSPDTTEYTFGFTEYTTESGPTTTLRSSTGTTPVPSVASVVTQTTISTQPPISSTVTESSPITSASASTERPLVDEHTTVTAMAPAPDTAQTTLSSSVMTTLPFTIETGHWMTSQTHAVLKTTALEPSRVCTSPYSEVVDKCTKLICVSGQLLLFNKSQSCPYDATPPNCGLLGFAVLVNGDKCCPRWDCPCRCSVFPDLNLITFDGKSVAIYKAALYVVTQLPNETVSILVQECSGPDDTLVWNFTHLCLAALNITHKSNEVLINRLQRRLYVNSRYAKPRFKKFGFEILDTGNMYLIRSPAGLKIQWFHTTGLMVIEMDSYNNRLPTVGLCGSCDGNPLNDLTLSNGTVVSEQEDPAVFIDSWQIPNTTSYVSHSRRREVNCTTGDCSQCMSMLSNRTFTICHPYVPPAMFCEMWVRDVEYVNNPCVALAAYAASCHKFNICMEWRSSDFCPFMCPDNLQYQACLPACTAPSCPNQEFEFVPEQCTGLSEGCVCPEGTLLHRPYSALLCDKCSEAAPVCQDGELLIVDTNSTECCCPVYHCLCETSRCLDITCPVGMAVVSTRIQDQCCPLHTCECACEKNLRPKCAMGESMQLDRAFLSDPENRCACKRFVCVREAVCVDGERGVMQPGQTLVEHRDQGVCYTTQCTHTLDSATGFYLLKATGTNCTARCQPNQIYIPPKDPSSCCGMCKNISCLSRSENGSVTMYKPGRSWVSDCMHYDCTDTLSGPVLVSHPYSCPPFNETECMKIGGTLVSYMDGCCKTCKEDGKSCQKVTVRMTIRKNDCRSNRPVSSFQNIPVIIWL